MGDLIEPNGASDYCNDNKLLVADNFNRRFG